MAEFVGREREISRLENIWDAPSKRTVKVFGRRRIGKTRLIKEFCRSRPSIYIGCIRGSISDNIHAIVSALNLFDGGDRDDPAFLSDALRELSILCRASKIVTVFDELPYLIESGQQTASILQHFIDDVSENTESMIIVCGSSIAMMNRETKDYNRPLYGRFAHSLKVEPLTMNQCAAFHPDMPEMDRLRLYLTIGGIPEFHLDGSIGTYRGYIETHFLSDEADMADEAEKLIGGELAPLGRYLSVVNAICDGSTSIKTIAERCDMERTMCSRCLEDLRRIGVVGIVKPMMDAPERPVFRIEDPLVAFCQSVVRESDAFLLKDPSERFDRIEHRLSSFLESRFEDLCMLFVIDNWRCIDIGRWWGPDRMKTVREIDIVARILEGDTEAAMLGECKFRNRRMSTGVFKELLENSELVGTDLTRRYVLFSASGFEEELHDLESDGAVTLVGPEEIMKWGLKRGCCRKASGSRYENERCHAVQCLRDNRSRCCDEM